MDLDLMSTPILSRSPNTLLIDTRAPHARHPLLLILALGLGIVASDASMGIHSAFWKTTNKMILL